MRATLIEGISRYHGGPSSRRSISKIAKRRGRNKARVALARKVLTLVYYGLRDGEIRCLAPIEASSVRLGHDQAASSTIGMTHSAPGGR